MANFWIFPFQTLISSLDVVVYKQTKYLISWVNFVRNGLYFHNNNLLLFKVWAPLSSPMDQPFVVIIPRDRTIRSSCLPTPALAWTKNKEASVSATAPMLLLAKLPSAIMHTHSHRFFCPLFLKVTTTDHQSHETLICTEKLGNCTITHSETLWQNI